MRFSLHLDEETKVMELRLGGARWRRKGFMSVPQVERLCRAIVESQGAEDVLERFGFRRYRPPRSRAA
jgi:hypothetical protein